jgi:hypothetical protein
MRAHLRRSAASAAAKAVAAPAGTVIQDEASARRAAASPVAAPVAQRPTTAAQPTAFSCAVRNGARRSPSAGEGR